MLIRFVCSVDDGRFFGVFECLAVEAVVGGVESTFGEPGDVALLECTVLDGLEIARPAEGVSGGL